MKHKERLDNLLVQRGLAESRSKAQALILAGQVRVRGQRGVKAGQMVSPEIEIQLEQPPEFVSRGGHKLEKALRYFNLNPAGKLALDIGSSTGGFTHCLLKYGAAKVYAVDVGKAQLHPHIRANSKVVALEGFNARYLSCREVPEAVDIIVIDVSFISLEKILPAALPLLKPEGTVLALVKPQFEAGVKKVGRGGVVKSAEVHKEVLQRVIEFAYKFGLSLKGLTYSPLKGAAGNIEYLAYFIKAVLPKETNLQDIIKRTIKEAEIL
jgi:23S rRNA (cytidine1920-2'-O)/16S rRNA (cytidine1409-2'-O)-methyltransferase